MDVKKIITGQSHLGLPTKDVDGTIRFYEQFAFEVEWKGNPEDSVFLRNGDCVVEIYHSDEPAMVNGGWDHVALNTPDIEAVYEYVKSLGYEALEGKICSLPFYAHGVRYFTIMGPNHEKLEFSQKL